MATGDQRDNGKGKHGSEKLSPGWVKLKSKQITVYKVTATQKII